jgi:hypothetical protein
VGGSNARALAEDAGFAPSRRFVSPHRRCRHVRGTPATHVRSRFRTVSATPRRARSTVDGGHEVFDEQAGTGPAVKKPWFSSGSASSCTSALTNRGQRVLGGPRRGLHWRWPIPRLRTGHPPPARRPWPASAAFLVGLLVATPQQFVRTCSASQRPLNAQAGTLSTLILPPELTGAPTTRSDRRLPARTGQRRTACEHTS